MANQNALHVSAPVKTSQLGVLEQKLAQFALTGFPFDRLDNVHFARLVLVPGAFTRSGHWLPDSLVLTTNFDGDLEPHLQQLIEHCTQELDLVFSCCNDYPGTSPSALERLNYFRAHLNRVAAHYVNTLGRSLEQVRNEAKLYAEIQAHLAHLTERPNSSEDVYRYVRELVEETPELNFALSPAEGDKTRAARIAKLILFALVGTTFLVGVLMFAPWLTLLITLLFVFVLRLHEIGNLPENYRPPNQRLVERQSEEEVLAQNQLSSVGFIQPGWFRRLLLMASLWGLEFGNKNIFYRGQLAGVDTIHFARWVICDHNRRLLFFSNFDGSPESYQDDFIERVAFGLNLVFSNGEGWPITRLLFFGGSRDEQAFRAFYRNHQIATQVWYAAAPYQGSTAVNLARNAKVRAGIARGLNAESSANWAALL